MANKWYITKTFITNDDHEIPEDRENPHPDEFTLQFRLLDDDKNVYFEGWMAPTEWGDELFEPLDFYGIDYGCTEIQIKRDGEWETV